MNREIKFRGKRKDNGEWVYGYLFVSWDWFYILWGTTNDIPNMIEVIPETVGQFTGLHDKNGVEIYEGDKVIAENSPTWEVGYQEKYCRYILWWNDSEDGESYVLFANIPLEIIGNIHENPELLKD